MLKTVDYEKAIEALGVQGLEMMKFRYGVNGQVSEAYARMGRRTVLKWDYAGRGFRFETEADVEEGVEVPYPEYLDYRRDRDFDLRF